MFFGKLAETGMSQHIYYSVTTWLRFKYM